MRSVGLLLPFFLLPLAVIGCGFWSIRDSGRIGVNRDDYKHACGQCHKLPKPRTKTDEEWQDFMMEHRFLSGQDEETAQLYADYLKRMN